MTPERWSKLCQSLDSLTGPALDEAITSHRAEVAQWPASVRHLEADSPWLQGVFEGRFDPRLELVGHATIQQRLEGERSSGGPQMFDLVRALAAHLDPAFEPPDALLGEEDNIRSAYGCGGGQAWWTRGNATQSIQFHSNATESPSSATWSATPAYAGVSEGSPRRHTSSRSIRCSTGGR